MGMYGYPPSHRDANRPQPEICPLCGTIAPADTFLQADVEGLRGWYLCGVTEGCRHFRTAMSWKDRRRVNPREHSYIGNSRVYEVNGIRIWGV